MSDFDSTFRRFSEAVVYGTLRSVWGVKVTGLERVPRSGPLIVAFNHTSLVDGPLLCVTIASARRPRFLGKQELFQIPAVGWFLRAIGMLPLQRGAADHSAMRAALEILEGSGSIGLAPEGTRVKPGETRPPKPGVGFLAAKAGAWVQPVRLIGASRFPRAFPLEVRFGSPLPPPTGEGREAASSYARSVMDAIYAL
jgi:1-acyl-sn-glycerol-3-phosphate acyltransferase